ncbi:Isochorismatase [Helicobacter heilmannii]|uniref:isochorismatase family protein n=1 Tax=Helicobacter heilmannii TaxID=35817 RepID=UPI0006A04EB1|nr:isochorismatase family protein [Helicobacter heilmannii]GMB94048.1 isochorismatase family protein [Helicobacter heilmannii]CRF47573.1 Isochorismatase [Helicobacter heilmannii]CRF49081.1 Isochorismatase [Helicobacter heilmannii]
MQTLEKPLVLLIDLQERLFSAMHQKEALLENCLRFLQIAKELHIPTIATEQNPAKLGETLQELRPFCEEIYTKQSFSAYPVLKLKGPLFVLGIEAHVCVYQSVLDFLKAGFSVSVVAECVRSRKPTDCHLALEDLRAQGARVRSLEMCAFGWLQTYTHPQFKAISKLIK